MSYLSISLTLTLVHIHKHIQYHFATQPLPSALAWYSHQLHPILLRLGVAATLLIELPATLLLVCPNHTWRIWGAILQGLLQLMIIATGNYNFFNLLTLVLLIPVCENEQDYSGGSGGSGDVTSHIPIRPVPIPISLPAGEPVSEARTASEPVSNGQKNRTGKGGSGSSKRGAGAGAAMGGGGDGGGYGGFWGVTMQSFLVYVFLAWCCWVMFEVYYLPPTSSDGGNNGNGGDGDGGNNGDGDGESSYSEDSGSYSGWLDRVQVQVRPDLNLQAYVNTGSFIGFGMLL